jgi:hypothetical protein
MTIHFPGGDNPVATAVRLRALADDLERMTMFQPRQELDEAPVLGGWGIALHGVPVLVGRAVGHPLLGCRNVYTTELYAIDHAGSWARTFSRFYRLADEAGTKECNR